MRTVFLTISFILTASSAFAQAGPNSLTMNCTHARAVVQQSGAVVMYTGPDIFDRYVSSGSYCAGNEWTEPAWVVTTDQKHCLVGQVCREIEINTR